MRAEKTHLDLCPVTFAEACDFIDQHHRHHSSPPGWKFGVGVRDADGNLRGVAIVGRPVARMRQDGETLEVTRCCTDGTPNVASMLYSACWRAARSIGYRRLGTYTLPHEGGASLRAAGWKLIGERGGGEWSRPSRERGASEQTETKWLWELAKEGGDGD